MALTQIQGIFNEVLYKEMVALYAAAEPYVRKTTEGFTFPRPFRDVLWRSALRKGHDTLGTVLQLVGQNKAGMALPLLRPMCEDLFYLTYIAELPNATADKLVILKAHHEVLESLLAQSEGDGNAAWASIGAGGKPSIQDQLQNVKNALAKEGESLGWRQGSYWPSVAHVAEKTGMKAVYDVVYHGSSRGVHFSPHHLMRMVWGLPNGPHSSSMDNFNRYYEVYALTNVGWLFCILIGHCWTLADAEPEDSLNELVTKLIKTLVDFGNVPIVTAEELMYPTPADPPGS